MCVEFSHPSKAFILSFTRDLLALLESSDRELPLDGEPERTATTREASLPPVTATFRSRIGYESVDPLCRCRLRLLLLVRTRPHMWRGTN